MLSLESNPFALTNKTILITGASSGIGRSIAILCSQMGARLVLTARDKTRLNETLLMLTGEGHSMHIADLTESDQLEFLTDELPKLDGIVHSAGVGNRRVCKSIEKMDIENVFNPNTFAPMLLQKAILEKKKINKYASIVFIASIAANYPSVGNGIYSASKGALISYARVLALELASRLIRVNCISPAMIWTKLVTADGLDKEVLMEDQNLYPLKRYGTPEDVANLTVFLLSNASNWMTGNNIELTGGIR